MGKPERSRWQVRPGTAHHILPAAGTMIGVSATLIGLVKIAEDRLGPSRVDEYSGLAAVVFLGSAFASYLSLRTEVNPRLSGVAEQVADWCFMIGLIAITGIAVLFAYEMI